MSVGTFFGSIGEAWHHSRTIAKRSFKILLKNPEILIYPYLAIVFILVTYPLVGRFVFNTWHHVQQPTVVTQVSGHAPHILLVHLGLVTFSVFYTIFVTSYFIAAMSVVVLAKLEDRKTPPLYGLWVVSKRFWRVSKFALLAIFFMPLGIIAQRRKLGRPKGVFEAISSSFSLSMSQLAPEVVTGSKGVFDTTTDTVETLGKAWRESLTIRIGTFTAILLFGLISFLPKVIEHYWFDNGGVHLLGWILTALFGASSYVLIRVIGATLTTTLYYEAKQKK